MIYLNKQGCIFLAMSGQKCTTINYLILPHNTLYNTISSIDMANIDIKCLMAAYCEQYSVAKRRY